MHRLQTFLTEVLFPTLSALSTEATTSKPQQLSLMRREVVEHVLWLHLGTEIGAFPYRQSRKIYTAYLGPFFQSLVSRDLDERAAMAAGRVYVAHSEESRALVLGLPRYANILVEKAMRSEDIFESERLEFRNAQSLSGLFQTLLLLHSRFAVSETVRQFTYDIRAASKITTHK